MWFVSIPLGFVSAFVFNFPSYIVYAVLISDELIKIGAGILRFVSKKWIKDIIRN
jgi:Na+-driven multidrug efflux pump